MGGTGAWFVEWLPIQLATRPSFPKSVPRVGNGRLVSSLEVVLAESLRPEAAASCVGRSVRTDEAGVLADPALDLDDHRRSRSDLLGRVLPGALREVAGHRVRVAIGQFDPSVRENLGLDLLHADDVDVNGRFRTHLRLGAELVDQIDRLLAVVGVDHELQGAVTQAHVAERRNLSGGDVPAADHDVGLVA